jgi:hypothetical protein
MKIHPVCARAQHEYSISDSLHEQVPALQEA